MSSSLLFKLTRHFWLLPTSLLVLFGIVLSFHPTDALTAAMQLLHGADEYFWSAPGAVQPDAEETSREALAGPAVGDACGCQVRLGLFVCCVQADTLPLPAAVSRLTACSAPGAVAVQAILSSVIVVRAGPLLLA